MSRLCSIKYFITHLIFLFAISGFAQIPDRSKLVEAQFRDITPDQYTQLITDLPEGTDYSDIEGLKRTIQTKFISDKNLRNKVAAGVDAMLANDPTWEEATKFALSQIADKAFYQESEKLLDLRVDEKVASQTPFLASTIPLDIKTEGYKGLNKQVEDVNKFIIQEEPAEEFTQRIKGTAPGVGVTTTQKSNERIKWEKQRDEINKAHQDLVVPFAQNSGLINSPIWNALSNAEQYSKYLETARNMSSVEEDISKINFKSRPDLDKAVKQYQLSGIKNFNIDGTEVGLDKFKKELGAKGEDMDEIADKMAIIGRDQMGRLVVQYSKEKRKGIDRKIVRFHPSNESKIAFDPIKKVVDNFNIKDAKPMKLRNEDGSVWIVDYQYQNGQLVPRIIEGEESDFIGIEAPDQISNFINNNQEYVGSLKQMSDLRYQQYNSFYEDFISKK